ncbi:hypothetical protein SALBM217S_06275 [Streptomyces griseoloalbus]
MHQTHHALQHGEETEDFQQSFLYRLWPRGPPARIGRGRGLADGGGAGRAWDAESLRSRDFGRRSCARVSAPTVHCIDLSTVTDDKAAKPPRCTRGGDGSSVPALIHELDPGTSPSGRRPRRTARDWLVDFSCFLLAVLVGLLGADALRDDTDLPHAVAVLDQVLGALSCAAVWLRRRRPLGLAVAMLPVSFVSETSGGVAVIALFTLAVHRPFRYVAWVGRRATGATPCYWWRPDPGLPFMASWSSASC